MWHQCYSIVTSMQRAWHLCKVYMTPMWHPSPLNCAAEEDLIPLISTLTMLFICTSYTVNFISFKQIYFINICLFACFHFNDINIFFGISLAASLVGGVSSSLGKVDAKMQILLHLKRFTKSRVCIRGDTDSPSRKARDPDQAVTSPARITNVHVRPIFIRPRFRLVSKSCRPSCVSRALTGNSTP